MIRYIFPAFFLLSALAFTASPVFAEEAPAEKSEAQLADEAAQEKAGAPKEEAKQEQQEEAAEKTEAPAAKEEKKEEAATGEEIPKDVQEHQKASEEVFKLTREIAEKLSPEEQKHFFVLYTNYNIIGTVKSVRDDSVGSTVKACGEKNPEMKEKMDARFAEWDAAVTPILKEAEANINNMVIAQEYAKPAQIKKIFKGLDKTRTLGNKLVDRIPVTSKEGCEHLLETMDDTQANFLRLLQGTLVSVPQIAPSVPEHASGEKETKEDAAEQAEEKSAEKPSDEEPQEKAN